MSGAGSTREKKATDHPDSVNLLDTGRVDWWLNNEQYVFKLPKLGEYRALRQIVLDGAQAQVDSIKEDGKALDGMDTMVSFMHHAFAALSDKPLLLDENEWPAWMVADQLQADLLRHWREVPLAPG